MSTDFGGDAFDVILSIHLQIVLAKRSLSPKAIFQVPLVIVQEPN